MSTPVHVDRSVTNLDPRWSTGGLNRGSGIGGGRPDRGPTLIAASLALLAAISWIVRGADFLLAFSTCRRCCSLSSNSNLSMMPLPFLAVLLRPVSLEALDCVSETRSIGLRRQPFVSLSEDDCSSLPANSATRLSVRCCCASNSFRFVVLSFNFKGSVFPDDLIGFSGGVFPLINVRRERRCVSCTPVCLLIKINPKANNQGPTSLVQHVNVKDKC